MNNKTLYFIVFVVVCLLPFSVKADECSDSKILELKEAAKNIDVIYRYDPEAITDGSLTFPSGYEDDDECEDCEVETSNENYDGKFEVKGSFDVIISGMNNKLFVNDVNHELNYSFDDFSNGRLVLRNMPSGNNEFEFYSVECGVSVRNVNINIPRRNPYHDDPLCEGISGEDLSVCGEFYEYDIDYATFKINVEQYKNELNNKKNEDNAIAKDNNDSSVDKIVNGVTSTFEDYYVYIIAGILLLIAIIIFIQVRRKRSVLE